MVVFEGRSSRLMMRHFALSFLSFISFALLWSRPASADILFEGYSKVLIEGVHVGFVIQRYEFDPKKQEFTSTSFLKVSAGGGSVTESIKARSTSTLRPIAYQYTELNGDKTKTIDAQFNPKTDMMTAVITDSGRKQNVSRKIPKGSFLASFLAYVMLQGKEGIKKGTRYSYQAIAEEDAALHAGEAYIEKEETVVGVNTYKVLNTFKDSQFISFVTYKGEVIATRSPIQKVATELAANVQEATAGQSFPSATIAQVFGSVPRAIDNPLARRSVDKPAEAVTSAPAATQPSVNTLQGSGTASPEKQKQLNSNPPIDPNVSPKHQGVPQGQGIMIKGQPPEKSAEKSSGK